MDLPKDIRAIVVEYMMISQQEVIHNKKEMNAEFGSIVHMNFVGLDYWLDTLGAKDILSEARCSVCRKYMYLRFDNTFCSEECEFAE